jgi:hypothetical protein
MSEDQMVRDLARHLDDRVDFAIADFLDSCKRMHVNHDRAVANVLTVLSTHLVPAAAMVEATESEFVTMCRWHFHQMKREMQG